MITRGTRVIRVRGMNAGMSPKDKGHVSDIIETTYGTFYKIREYRGMMLHESECFKELIRL